MEVAKASGAKTLNQEAERLLGFSPPNGEIESLRREIERLQALASRERGMLDAILHHSPHGIIVCDATGKRVLQNLAAEKIWAGSATVNDAQGWGQYRAFHEDGSPYETADWAMARCLAEGKSVGAEEVRVQRFDGTQGILLESSSPITSPSGEVEGALSVFADITRLKEAEERLRIVTDALPTLVGYVDREERYRFNNLAYEKWFGQPRASCVGKHIAEVLGTRAYEAARSLIARALAGETVTFQSWIMYLDGQNRYIEATYVPDFGPDGAVRGFVALVSDMSERARLREAERAAHARAERAHAETALLYHLADTINRSDSLERVYDATFETIQGVLGVERASILLFDADGVIRFKAWRHLSERYRAAVEGRSTYKKDDPNPTAIFVADVEQNPAVAGYLPHLRSEGIASVALVPLVYEGRLLGKFVLYSATPRWFSAAETAVLRIIADQLASGIGRRLAQQERDKLIEELRQTVYLNELFSGVLAHDLRNPLGAMLTAAETLVHRGDGERVEQPASRILRSGERMKRMIEQLLDFTRCRIGKGIPFERQEIDLVPLSRQVIAELNEANPGRRIQVDVVGNLSGSWDPDRLAQVISNLVGNAVQHGSKDAPIEVGLDGVENDAVTLLVKNRGAIPTDSLPALFDPFRRSEQRTERVQRQSLGLGLYITKQIVTAHGGSLAVTSSHDSNETTFFVRLPRRGPSGDS